MFLDCLVVVSKGEIIDEGHKMARVAEGDELERAQSPH